MSSDKKGFMLPEILTAVIIVSFAAFLIFSAAESHMKTSEKIGSLFGRMEERTEEAMRGGCRCEAEGSAEEADS